MNISLFGNFKDENVFEIAKNVVKELLSNNCNVYISKNYENSFGGFDAEFVQEESLMDKCDVAVAIGGDGTTMKIAKNAAIMGKLALGINAGRLGFLSGIEKDELVLLKNVAEENFEVDERTMLKAEIIENGKVLNTFHCLNDAVISRGDFARLIDIKITSENRELWNVRADGVIISTPTGSTAYSMAAGGPVLSPDLASFVVTSICPHSLMDRSIVVNSKKQLEIKTFSDVSNNAIVTCDGEEPIIIGDNSVVRISLSKYKTRLIKVKPDNFYEILKKKIIERRF